MVSTRSSSAAAAPNPTTAPPSGRRTQQRKPTTTTAWSHTPHPLTLAWLALSLPLVVWDTAYVLGRPHTMEHGAVHWPLWLPYRLYGEVDHVYGRKAFDARSGFTGAQAALNAVETAMYLLYAAAVLGATTGVGVRGRKGGRAVLVGFSAAVMTLSKTVLYWLHEYYSGFDNIGHNDVLSLVFLWIIPNGAWLLGSAWMIYSLGADILRAIETASHSKTE